MTSDLRKVRFASIDGLTRDDLPLANEVWLQEMYKAPWATREMMKIASILVRYMDEPARTSFTISELEIGTQMSAEEVRKTLAAMKGFGAIDQFVAEKVQVQVALNLSLLQRLQVLEVKRRFATALPGAARIWQQPGEKWAVGKAA